MNKKPLTDTQRINSYRRLLKEATHTIEDLLRVDLERSPGARERYEAQAAKFVKKLKELKK